MNLPGKIPTANTIMARHLAAIFDNLLAMVLGVVAAKMFNDGNRQLQLAQFVLTYLAYFFIFEIAISRTPGKVLTGLIVVRKDGSRISALDVFVRTVLRIFEVNPALLGYAPAAISIIFSAKNQRIGDRIVGTIVVSPNHIP